MKYTVTIRDAAGTERVYDPGDEYGDVIDFLWMDGNYSCDCNRHLFFVQAGGDSPSDADWEHPCGHTKYSVPYLTLADGTVILIAD